MNKKGILLGLIRLVIGLVIFIGLIYLFNKYYDVSEVVRCLFETCRK